MPWLEILIGWLCFGAGWFGCALFTAWADDHRRGTLDFTLQRVTFNDDWAFPPPPTPKKPATPTYVEGGRP